MSLSELTPVARLNFDSSVAFLTLSTAAVIARFAGKLSTRLSLTGPDWLCLLALVFFYGYCIVIYNFIWNVSEFHALDFNPLFPPSEVKNFLIAVFIIEIFFTLLVTSVKLSILWFYYQIFGVSRMVSKVILGLVGLCIVWFFVALFPLIIFQCHPVDALWNQFDAPPACLPSQRILLGYELSNFFIDVAILAVPVATIGKLQLSRTKKIGVSLTFLLGSFVCIASIVRLTTIFDARHPDQPVSSSQSLLWSTIQAGIAIICSCIPTYGPLFAGVSKTTRSIFSRYGSRGSRTDKSRETGGPSQASRANGDNWTKVGSSDDRRFYPSSNKSNEHILQPLPPRSKDGKSHYEVV